MSFKIIVDTSAKTLSSAIRQAGNFFAEEGMPQLVLGDNRNYRLAFYDMQTTQLEPWSGDMTYTLQVGIGTCAAPTGGTFTLTFDGDTTGDLPVTATPAQVQTALEGLASIGAGNVRVTGVAGLYKVEYIGALADQDVQQLTGDATLATPDSRVAAGTYQIGGGGQNEIQTIQLQQTLLSYQDTWTPYTDGTETGWEGTLSTASLELAQRIQESDGVNSTIEIKVIDPNGNARTYVKRGVEILCRIINPSAFVPSPMPTPVTSAEVIALLNTELRSIRYVMTSDLDLDDTWPRNIFLDPDGVDRQVTLTGEFTAPMWIQNDGTSGIITLVDVIEAGVSGDPVLYTGDSVAILYDTDTSEFRVVGRTVANYAKSIYEDGDTFFVNASASIVSLNSNDIEVVLDRPGKWLVQCNLMLDGAGLTISGSVMNAELYAPSYIPESATVINLGSYTTYTGHISSVSMPPVFIDVTGSPRTVSLWAMTDNNPDAGNLNITAASIVAHRIGA